MANVLERLKALKKEEFVENYVVDLSLGDFSAKEAENCVDAIMLREEGKDWFDVLKSKIIEGFNENEEKGEDSSEIFDRYYMDFFTTIDEQRIDFKNGRYSDWGLSGKYGNQEFIVDEGEAEEIALKLVKQYLEENPETFNKDWLMGHIDEDRYFSDVESDIANWVYESPESYTAFIDNEEPEEEDGTYSEDQIEKMTKGYLEDIKSGGLLTWLEGLGYDGDKLFDQISPYLDLDEASQDAIDTDGWAHFLSTYNGDYEDGEHDVVFFRS